MKADVSAQVVEAFDINDKANDVYELNFGHRPYQVPPPNYWNLWLSPDMTNDKYFCSTIFQNFVLGFELLKSRSFDGYCFNC